MHRDQHGRKSTRNYVKLIVRLSTAMRCSVFSE
jgi:hypothetical protein